MVAKGITPLFLFRLQQCRAHRSGFRFLVVDHAVTETELIDRDLSASRVVLHCSRQKRLGEEKARNPEHCWLPVNDPRLSKRFYSS